MLWGVGNKNGRFSHPPQCCPNAHFALSYPKALIPKTGANDDEENNRYPSK